MARLGRQGIAWHGSVRRAELWLGAAGKVSRGEFLSGWVWRVEAGLGRRGGSGQVRVGQGMAWCGKV